MDLEKSTWQMEITVAGASGRQIHKYRVWEGARLTFLKQLTLKDLTGFPQELLNSSQDDAQ